MEGITGQKVEVVALDEGVFIHIKKFGNIGEILNELREKMEKLKVIFTEEDSIGLIITEQPSLDELVKILSIFEEEKIKLFDIKFGKPVIKKKKPERIPVGTGAIFLKKNIRSGQKVETDGDVILVGNLNLGAEIRAGGNIIVYGLARGGLIAGLNIGNRAVVSALDFRPSLLRIGDHTVTAEFKGGPIHAYVRNDKVVFEEYDFEGKGFLERKLKDVQRKRRSENEVEL